MCIPTIRELPYMTDFLKIAKSIEVPFGIYALTASKRLSKAI